MQQVKATVIGKTFFTKDVFKLTLFAPTVAKEVKAGQFIYLLCGQAQQFILRRPFSVHQVSGDSLELLIKVVGQGTAYLSHLNVREQVDFIGPLGRPFNSKGVNKALIVAGGMGIAPLFLLAQQLAAQKVKTYALLGAPTRDLLFSYMDIKRLARKVEATTEDGSFGHQGKVTDLLSSMLNEVQPDMIYACGPLAMLQAVSRIASQQQINCQVSLEARMACGVGACYGCTVNGKAGYLKVCSDGPVFSAEELVW
jgi:dihydroorotate dehydrogenase electron transfer subunit